MGVRHGSGVVKMRARDARGILAQVVLEAGHRRAARLKSQIGALRLAIRDAVGRSGDPTISGHVARRWLNANVAEVDDQLLRSAIAALALLGPTRGELPPALLMLYAETRDRLAARLTDPHPYDPARLASDFAMASGATASAGALSIVIPPKGALGLSTRLRHAAGGAVRLTLQRGLIPALAWLATFRARPMLELHVDTSNLRDFSEEGFRRTYRRLAAMLDWRTDIAGVYGASWLYDPALTTVSPSLAFIRSTLEDTDVRYVRLRTDPIQVAYAISRSLTRRRLHEQGAYDPACYGMFWGRRAVLDWAVRDREQTEASPAKAPRRAAARRPLRAPVLAKTAH